MAAARPLACCSGKKPGCGAADRAVRRGRVAVGTRGCRDNGRATAVGCQARPFRPIRRLTTLAFAVRRRTCRAPRPQLLKWWEPTQYVRERADQRGAAAYRGAQPGHPLLEQRRPQAADTAFSRRHRPVAAHAGRKARLAARRMGRSSKAAKRFVDHGGQGRQEPRHDIRARDASLLRQMLSRRAAGRANRRRGQRTHEAARQRRESSWKT